MNIPKHAILVKKKYNNFHSDDAIDYNDIEDMYNSILYTIRALGVCREVKCVLTKSCVLSNIIILQKCNHNNKFLQFYFISTSQQHRVNVVQNIQ